MDENEFDEILKKSTQAIGHEYFLLERSNGSPIHRERVYCYELYHQMRKEFELMQPGMPCFEYRLNGEVDKGSHFEACVKNKKPDFIVHKPGFNKNYAVIEVKSVTGLRKDSIKKDCETLHCFLDKLSYERGIFFVFGDKCDGRITKYYDLIKKYPQIELWCHCKAEKMAIRCDTGTSTLDRNLRGS